MSECHEVAIVIADTLTLSVRNACAKDIHQCDIIVQRSMPDETLTIRSNVADSLHRICKQRMPKE